MGYFTCANNCGRKICAINAQSGYSNKNSSYSDYFNAISGLYRTAEPPGGPCDIKTDLFSTTKYITNLKAYQPKRYLFGFELKSTRTHERFLLSLFV